RVRKTWTKQEDEKLLKLYNEMGPRWTAISRQFKDRLPATIRVHVWRLLEAQNKQLEDGSYHGYTGPWTDEEIEALRSAMKGKDPNNVDWETIQAQLPRKRPPLYIKNTWKFSLDPKLRHGKWTAEETDALAKLVKVYGTENWDAVAEGIPTRTRRQCLERWRWQQDRSIEKGVFTQAEDELLLAAVKKHGDSDWPLIAAVMKTGRTPRQLASRYKYAFNPETDRSEWTPEERLRVYDT
ncbi:Homeodomain-like protein, partial [Syncephalastrum racemosum]